MNNIVLIDEKAEHTVKDLTDSFPGKDIVAVDFVIQDIWKQNPMIGGFWQEIGENKVVINIDHHAPVKVMERIVSSTNQAINHVKIAGFPFSPETVIVLNHTDADSILAALILTGALKPESRFGKAAIAADHTAEPNNIADLLGSLQRFRNIELSVRNLMLLLDGKEVEEVARLRLIERAVERAQTKLMAEDGLFHRVGDIVYAVLDQKVDTALLPPYFPSAKLIVTFSPMPDGSEAMEVKIRLSNGAPEGLSLNMLRIQDFDAAFGGRWNAGANKRGGGTTLTPEVYVNLLADNLRIFCPATV